MPSRHAHRFNHDEDADGYDEDVRTSGSPIRRGYAEVLGWVVEGVAGDVVDLGAGTGNLALLCPPEARLTCVDVSAKMLDLARPKLEGREVTYVEQDLLDFAREAAGPWDAVISTYAIHHLEDDEKRLLLDALAAKIRPGGRLAFGDLMFEHDAGRAELLERLPRLQAVVDDEYFWPVDQACGWLEAHGLTVEARRFSDLSWGIRAVRG